MLYITFFYFGIIHVQAYLTLPIVLEHLFEVISECFLHFKFVSRVRPRKLNSFIFSMFVLLIWSVGSFTCLFGLWKTYI